MDDVKAPAQGLLTVGSEIITLCQTTIFLNSIPSLDSTPSTIQGAVCEFVVALNLIVCCG